MYMVVSRHQNAGQYQNLLTAKTFFENVSKWTTVASENCIYEEITNRLNSGNVCYHFDQNLLSSRLHSTNLKIKIFKIINLPIVLYGCETWSLTLRGGSRLRVYEKRMLRRIFEGECGSRLHNEEPHNLYALQSIIRVIIKSRRMRLAGYAERMGVMRI